MGSLVEPIHPRHVIYRPCRQINPASGNLFGRSKSRFERVYLPVPSRLHALSLIYTSEFRRGPGTRSLLIPPAGKRKFDSAIHRKRKEAFLSLPGVVSVEVSYRFIQKLPPSTTRVTCDNNTLLRELLHVYSVAEARFSPRSMQIASITGPYATDCDPSASQSLTLEKNMLESQATW